MTLSARVNASIAFTQTSVPDSGVTGSAKAERSVSTSRTLADGVANSQADLAFADERSLASGIAEDLDLAGVLLDAFGNPITCAEVTSIQIVADPTNTTNLTVGPDATAGFLGPFGAATHTVTLKPGATALFDDPVGWLVTPATGDLLQIANAAGAAAKYKVAVLGRSAAS